MIVDPHNIFEPLSSETEEVCNKECFSLHLHMTKISYRDNGLFIVMFVNLSIICLHFELDQSGDFDTASSNAGSERGKHVSDLLKT